MRSLGYGVVETIGSLGGRAGRVDSCGLYFREDNWKCLNHETIRLDDLAILRSSSESDDRVEKNHNEIKNKRRRNDNGDTQSGRLKGFERSFVRKNVTLLARMEHKPSRRQVVIVVSHLFWNPAYDYVKVRTHYCLFSIYLILEVMRFLISLTTSTFDRASSCARHIMWQYAPMLSAKGTTIFPSSGAEISTRSRKDMSINILQKAWLMPRQQRHGMPVHINVMKNKRRM